MSGTVATPLGRRDVVLVSALLLLGVGLPLAMAIAAGAIGVPSNDEWVYVLGADSLYRTGTITMPSHTASAVGQILLMQPLLSLAGGASWAYSAFGLVMAAVGISSAYLLARPDLGRPSASLVAVLVIAIPGFARQSAGFMTDVPAFALAMLSLLLGVRWLRCGHWPWLLASMVVGVVAVSVREFALAAPVAILAAAWLRHRPAERGPLLAATVLTGAGVAAVLVGLRSTALHGGLASPDLVRVYTVGPALATLAAILLAAAVPAFTRRLDSLRPLHVILGVGLVAFAFAVPTIGPLVGQFWMADGLVGNALLSGTRQPVIGPAAWMLSEALAVMAAVLMAILTMRWAMRRLAGVHSITLAWARLRETGRLSTAPLLLFLVVYACELAFFVSLNAYPLDRYLYPMVPVAAILLLRKTAGRGWRLSRPLQSAALAWLSASALLITTNSFAYDAARWRAGEGAVALGYAAETVDAGYDWVGFHAGTHINAAAPAYGLTWYDDAFMVSPPCAVVSNSALDVPGYTLLRVDSTAYRQYLLVGPDQPLYLYGGPKGPCPAPPG